MEGFLMGAAAGAIESVIPKLAILLEEGYQIQKGVRRDIEFLQDELRMLEAFLLKCSEEEGPGEQVKILARDARELSYDIEDSVDELIVGGKREPGPRPGSFHGLLDRIVNLFKEDRIRHRMAMEIKDIKSRIKEVRDRSARYGSDCVASSVSRVTVDPRLAALFVEASNLVGVGGPRDELVKLLMEDSESAARLKVITVFGFGGLGKTTLANEVYRKTEAYFQCRAWVSVSQNPNMKNTLMQILRQVERRHRIEDDGTWDFPDLIGKIRESLRDKRYLVVLDDIWSTQTWDFIRSAFPFNSLASRIITTTRIQSVARSCSSHWSDLIYQIKPLSMKDSRTLFYRRIFGSEDSCPQPLVDLSEEILKKCGGLPLAITTISSLLAYKSQEEWQSVYNSISATLERSATLDGMRRILLLSFYDLPHHLKTCLLYLSIFPEDYVINHDRLVRRWIAEGFVQGIPGSRPEQVGQFYFDELINRSLIQPVHGSYDGKPDACIIHGMILDLIKSMSIEENFATFLGDDAPVSGLHGKIRRLSITNANEDHYTTASSHLRSLTIFGNIGLNFSFQHFTLLRVLDLEGCKDLKNHNIKEIAGLLHLRYFSIRDTPISELPDQIGLLEYLTMLDLRGTKLRELPVSIVRLQRLAYLLCDKMRFPVGIEKMAELSSLSQFDILQSEISVVEELGNLPELKELVIWCSPDIASNNTRRYERLAFSLYRLYKLQSLLIHGDDTSVELLDHLHHSLPELQRIELHSSCYLSKIPEWFRSLPKLTNLRIDVKKIKNKELQLLSELPLLLTLSLSSKIIPTEKLVICSKGFHVLREFHLKSARADLNFEPQAMQKVEKLLLSLQVLTEETYGFSFSIKHLTNLKKIEIRIDGEGADAAQIKATEVAIWKAADNHPKHPMVNIITLGSLADHEAKEEKEKEQKPEIQII